MKTEAGVNNTKTIDFPGTDIQVQVRVLNEQDQLDATLATDKIFRVAGSKIDRENVEAYEAEKNNQLLYRALRNPDDGTPLASTITEFRQLLSEGRRKTLRMVFCVQKNAVLPLIEWTLLHTSPVQSVKKNAERMVTNLSSIVLARKLIITLANQLVRSQTDNGSSSSQ